jgi:hypothetical protein
MHTVNNVMRNFGLQFAGVVTENAHFVNRKHARFFDFTDMMNDGHKGPVDLEQGMVNAEFVNLFDSQSASNQGAWVRAAFGLNHRALPVSVYRLLLRVAQYLPTVIVGGEFKLGHYLLSEALDTPPAAAVSSTACSLQDLVH